MALPETRLAEIADLVKWYPQFGDEYEIARPGMRQCAIDHTTCLFEDECLWGCQLLLAHIHAAAHTLTVNQRSSGGDGDDADKGRIASMSMGPVRVAYESSTATGMTGEWSSTSAGQAFLRIRDELGPMSYVPDTGCDDFLGGIC